MIVEPEEILLDPLASRRPDPYERLEFPVPPFWGKFFLGLLIVILAVLAALIAYDQAVRGSEFFSRAEENRLRFLFEDAPRGTIVDSRGKIVAENKMIFDLSVSALELPKDDALLADEAKILGAYLGVEPAPILDNLKKIGVKNLAEPTLIAENVSRDAALVLKSREEELPGITVSGRYQRHYPFGQSLANVIGYTGRVSSQELKANPDLRPKDQIGRQGLEAEFDDILRGKRGETRYEVDARLKVRSAAKRIAATAGQKLKLTIDAELQDYFYWVMRSQMERAGLERGAGIALDPRTGEILALVSLPGYDNNLFARGISQDDFKHLTQAKSQPLFNRPIGGEYSPGSVIKPFIAAAALQEGVITPETKVTDYDGFISVTNRYDPARPTIFKDWKAHGVMTVEKALAESCNVFFYAAGGGWQDIKGLGIERIKKYLTEFGFGTTLGINVPGERPGLIPDPDWKAKNRQQDSIWRIGDTYLTSIGQGDLLVTPLQLAAATAAIANGGKLYKPQLVKEVISDEKVQKEFSPQLIRQLPIDDKWLAVVRAGMRQAVISGTASELYGLPLEVAGKTGTAQILSNAKTNAFFTSFAPYDNPRIVIVIVVEEGRGGMTNAVPVAREVLSWWWWNRQTGQVE